MGAPTLDLTGRDIRTAYFVPGDIYIEEPRSLLDAYMAALEDRLTAIEATALPLCTIW